jgi:hypothetical protein
MSSKPPGVRLPAYPVQLLFLFAMSRLPEHCNVEILRQVFANQYIPVFLNMTIPLYADIMISGLPCLPECAGMPDLHNLSFPGKERKRQKAWGRENLPTE